jgi:hypothetical protein
MNDEWEDIAYGAAASDDWEDVSYGSGISRPPTIAAATAIDSIFPQTPEAPPEELQSIDRIFTGGIGSIAEAGGFSFGDELMAALASPLASGMSLLTDNPMGPSEAYNRILPDLRGDIETFRRQNPIAGAVTSVGGSLAVPIPKVGKLFSTDAGLMNAASNIVKGSALGAGLGGVYGFGAGEGGLQNRLENAFSNLELGAILGGGGQTLLEAIQGAPRIAGKLLAPFSKGGQESLAGQELLQNAGKEGAAKLQEFAKTGPIEEVTNAGNKLTYAEVAGTPSAAAYQVATRKLPGEGANIMESALVGTADEPGRLLANQQKLQELAPSSMSGITPDIRGATIRSKGLGTIQESDALVKQAWDEVGKGGQKIAISQLPEKIKNLYNELQTPLGFSSRANKVVDSFFKAKNNPKTSISISEYQKIRSAAGEVLAEAGNFGHQREAALMAGIRDMLDETVETVANSSSMQGAKLTNLKKAIDITREQKNTYGIGSVKDIFQKGEGGYRLRESAIPSKVISTPETAKQFMKAFGNDLEMVGQARATLIDDMVRTKEPGTWIKNFQQKKAQYQAIFGDDVVQVQSVLDDIASLGRVNEMANRASKGQSVTAQALSVVQKLFTDGPRQISKLLASSKGGGGAFVGGAFLGGAPGAAIGGVAHKVARWSEQNIQRLISEAMVNPVTLKLLTQKATPKNMFTVLNQVLPKIMPGMADMGARSGYRYTPAQQAAPTTQQHGWEDAPVAQTPDMEINPISQTPMPQKKDVTALIEQQHPLVQAIISVESDKRPNVTSPVGARGLMQVMPANLKKLGIKDGYDPQENIKAGIAMLSEELDRYGDLRVALAAYNAGSPKVNAAIRKAGGRRDWYSVAPYLPAETRAYVPKVMAQYSKLATT